MAAYLYVEVRRIFDPEQYGRYVAAVRPIIQSHGGAYMLVGNQVSALSEEAAPERVVLIRFPDRESLDRCFASSEYAQIAPLRLASTASRALVIEEDPPAADDGEARG